ncbi:MAG: hypothetical protein Q9186_002125 [Xanthomendoza sp. 1 TL-2023]
MTERLRNLVFCLTGVQLQELWQKTVLLITSGQSLDGTLSPLPSPHQAIFRRSKPQHLDDDDQLQETIPPFFHTQSVPQPDGAPEDGGRSVVDTTYAASKAPPATTNKMLSTMAGSAAYVEAQPQTTDSPNRSFEGTSLMGSDGSPYASASTQTDLPTSQSAPPTDYEDVRSECRPNLDEFDGEKAPIQGHGQHTDDRREYSVQVSEGGTAGDVAPEVFDGPSSVVVSNHNDKNYLAILVTKEMIKRLEEISQQSNKLEYSTPRFAEAEKKVNLTRINLECCEDLLEDVKSKDESDRLREDIAQHRVTLPEDERRRDHLEQEVIQLRETVAYMEGLFTEMCQRILTTAGLLDIKDEHVEEEQTDMEDGRNERSKPLEGDRYPVHQSEGSSISIDELARRAVNEEVRQRHAELVEIEHEFDTRQEGYTYQKGQFHQMIREGTCRMTQTEFDHADLEATREMTTDLREAEEKYEEALARRNKLGPNEDDQESGFIDDEYDGYPLSWENDGIVFAPVAKIKKWLEDIPEVEELPLEAVSGFVLEQESLEDCDIRSAGMSDTWSCQDWSRTRKRIDRWREVAGRDR